jgi:predicted dehydrogenase
MSDQEVIRVGFIGAGDICRSQHLPRLPKIPGVEVVAVANRSRASSQKVAEAFGIGHVADDWRALLERDDVDAVFIGTWPYMHSEISVATLEAGKHCFCQARMAMNLAEARTMFAAAQAHPELVNMICPTPTRMPVEPYVRQVLGAGELGRITAVQVISVGGSNLDRDSVHWRERLDLSGNQMLLVGLMAEHLNAWVGPYAELGAQLATPIATKRGEAGADVTIGIPQIVTISGRLASGALAVEHHSGVATDKTSGQLELTIWGLDGTLRYCMDEVLLMARAGEELKPVDVPSDLHRPWQVELDFITAVRAARQGEPAAARPVSPDFAEGLRYMQKLEAVHASAASGKAVSPASL